MQMQDYVTGKLANAFVLSHTPGWPANASGALMTAQGMAFV